MHSYLAVQEDNLIKLNLRLEPYNPTQPNELLLNLTIEIGINQSHV